MFRQLIILLLAITLLTACGNEVSQSTSGEKNEETIDHVETVQEWTDEQEPLLLENDAFRNISVTGQRGEYTITGEARVWEATMHYAVSDGHVYFVEDFYTLPEGAPNWAPFSLNISIPEERLPVNGTVMLELFEISAKDGSQVNLLFVPLETIGYEGK